MSVQTVWSYFTKTANEESAVCNFVECSKPIRAVGGSTSGMHAHLKAKHGINILKRTQCNKIAEKPSESAKSKNGRIISFLKTEDNFFPAVVSRMTAKHGFPFAKFCTFLDLCTLLTAKSFKNISKSPNTIVLY